MPQVSKFKIYDTKKQPYKINGLPVSYVSVISDA
jgi:hypothetical protein